MIKNLEGEENATAVFHTTSGRGLPGLHDRRKILAVAGVELAQISQSVAQILQNGDFREHKRGIWAAGAFYNAAEITLGNGR